MTSEATTSAYGSIEVRGARENNLKDVSVDVPKRALTVFTGVSGSGKSSLVFDTIAAESRRLINETYTAFLQNFMGSQARPEVDALRGLTAAIIVDQERLTPNTRSTVGTVTDAYSMLRILFSRIGEPHIGGSGLFSFNLPGGMCPECEGTGKVSALDLDGMVDWGLSLDEGAILLPNFAVDSWYWRIFAVSGLFDTAKKLGDYTEAERQDFFWGEERKLKVEGMNLTYEGLANKFRRLFLAKDVEAMQPHVRAVVERVATFAVCPDCGGSRLAEAPRSVRVQGRAIHELSDLEVTELAEWLRGLDAGPAAPVVAELQHVLDSFVQIGLGYLSLSRESGTLSGGEAQRVKMVRHLGSALTDATYVFDEPTVGLHPHDIQRMLGLIESLRDKGNTVLVIEHKAEVVAAADHVVDMGPGAGTRGGEVVYAGDVAGLRAAGTATGAHLVQRQELNTSPRTPTGAIRIEHADTHNLRDVTVEIPRGVLVAVTGVAGSGKSSLVHGHLAAAAPEAQVIDQGTIRGSRRSNPATYTGMLDGIRKAFAAANGVKPALFSANSEGACPTCKGNGVIYTDLAFMAGVVTVCEDCEGKRFTPEVLSYTLRDKDISQVLAMPVSEAKDFFTEKAVAPMAKALDDVGLGYLALGQPLTTLSGGERQRLKLAIAMAGGKASRAQRKGEVFVLDEPTASLHPANIDTLLDLLQQVVEEGRSVIVIEHSLDVVARADWVIDLGPGAGSGGGEVVFEGTPAQLAEADTLTGRALSAYLSG